jgi:hypothetical protein
MDSIIKIQFAERCAWRAVYISWTATETRGYSLVPLGIEKRILTLGVDPEPGKPKVFGCVFGRDFRFRVPLLFPWKSTTNRLRVWLYQKENRLWHSLDGRYRGLK